jgi:hypothetical protein
MEIDTVVRNRDSSLMAAAMQRASDFWDAFQQVPAARSGLPPFAMY